VVRLTHPLLLGLAAMGLCAACGLGPSGAEPRSGIPDEASTTPAAASHTSLPTLPLATEAGGAAADPVEVPAMPGARRTSIERDVDDGLATIEIEYVVDADIEEVRRHYRRVMQEHGWRVGEVDVDDGGWELQASKGSREVEVEIEPDGRGAHVEVAITDVAAPSSSAWALGSDSAEP
jgi:hypothetical protein